ncbi:MAG: TerB family tellurite resistance protein [Muribaculaceae bacterium]|nr:TerB family tellurite resistance protein [Muribaculaceae bacterium]
MKSIERAAITRILVDLIKADKVIDRREIEMYMTLKETYGISRQDEITAYNMSLSKAITVLKDCDKDILFQFLYTCREMALSDGLCAREEALLLTGLQHCLSLETANCNIISEAIDPVWFEDNQILYVESRYNKQVNHAIKEAYRAITNEFKLCGFEFVFIPLVAQNYIDTPPDLLGEIVAMLRPSMTTEAIRNLIKTIKLLKTDSFCIEQLHHKLGFTDLMSVPPSFLIKIGQSRVGEKIFANYLCLHINLDIIDILGQIQRFTDMFLNFHSTDNVNLSLKRNEQGRFLYMGFYRQLFEILTFQKAVTCHLLVDFIHGNIYFPEVEVELSRLHRQEKALYTLFIYESRVGGINFTAPVTTTQFEVFNKYLKLIQRKYALIYRAFGGEAEKAPDITDIDKRSPMITRIKKAILQQRDKIYEAERFIIARNREGTYSINAAQSAFLVRDFQNTAVPINIFGSELFLNLGMNS